MICHSCAYHLDKTPKGKQMSMHCMFHAPRNSDIWSMENNKLKLANGVIRANRVYNTKRDCQHFHDRRKIRG